ncbi:MAG: hypothetical protein JNG86_11615 [Verrucomicrobiaceae bacterium]|nr:hypothetical protein [Verrucomicrobiaceae bacterium]
MKFLVRLLCLMALGVVSVQVPKPPRQVTALQNKLSTLILPNVAFQDATLDEAVEYLRLKCHEADPRPDPSASGINFVLLASSKKNLNIQLRAVPAAEAVRCITELAGLSYIIEPHAIVIGPKGFQMRNPPPKLIAVRGQEAVWQRVVKPTVQFQKATIEEACEYLSQSIRHASDFEGERPAFNIILKSTPEASARLLDLDLKNIPTSEALRYFAELSGLKLRFDREAIVLSPEGDDMAKIELRGKAAEKLRADQIILPNATFESASPTEVADFVRIKSAEIAPAKKPINVVVGVEIDPKVSCSLDVRRMSVTELLRYSAGLMNLKLSADDHAFLLSPK